MKKVIVCVLLAVAAISFAKMNEKPLPVIDGVNSLRDNGNWVMKASNFPNPATGIGYVDVVDENVAWAAGYDGSGGGAKIQDFIRSVDGGNTWTPGTVPGATGGSISMICAVSDMKAWVAIHTAPNAQGIYHTSDGGQTWERQESANYNYPTSFPNVVHFFNENDGFCQGDGVDGYLECYTTTDGGANWTRVPEENLAPTLPGEWGVVGYYDAIGDNIWFSTNKGRVYRSSDKGYTWEASQIEGNSDYTDVRFINPDHGIAGRFSNSSNGEIWETFDGGITWASISFSGMKYHDHIDAVPGTENTWVSTGVNPENAGASYSFDGGHTWTSWDVMEGIQMLAMDWYNNTTGIVGDFNTDPNRGVFLFDGVLGTSGIDESAITANGFALVSNYPNPFNPETTISFTLNNNENINLSVYNSHGEKVSELASGEFKAGSHSVNFDGKDLASGVYYTKLSSVNGVVTSKMILVK
ncbi:MAG: hypothetical protein CR982_00080 [Candidatus Cloacimonadota bacterium]|nr:MAG: hypothetical protein CR982_00080 [Candidatus Cloacimonadota bacterium]PIE78331.1 MAG: hypothetical protein CSA15_08320 [Candidatus Delongbacteria bacterium]